MSAGRGDPPALLVHRLPQRRLLTAGVWLLHGSAHDPAPLAGATHLLEHLTLRRCGDHDRGSLARLVDRLGGEVDAWTAAELMGVTVHTTVDVLPEALGLLADAVLTPTFDRDDVELELRVIMAEIEMVRDDPAEQVDEAILTAAWGDHPLARPVLGSTEALHDLDPTRLRQHHAHLVQPGRVLVAVAGDVDGREVRGHLGRLPIETAPQVTPLPPLTWCGGQRVVVREGADQVHARLAFPALSASDSGVPALAVLNRVLGVGASSRLFQRLREDEGLTYDVWSDIALRIPGGLLEVGWTCAPATFGESWRLIREELVTLAEDIAPEEVEVAVESLVRGLEMDADSPAGLCALDVAELLQRGQRFTIEHAVDELRRVDLAEVRQAARTILRLEHMARALCGPDGVAERVW